MRSSGQQSPVCSNILDELVYRPQISLRQQLKLLEDFSSTLMISVFLFNSMCFSLYLFCCFHKIFFLKFHLNLFDLNCLIFCFRPQNESLLRLRAAVSSIQTSVGSSEFKPWHFESQNLKTLNRRQRSALVSTFLYKVSERHSGKCVTSPTEAEVY